MSLCLTCSKKKPLKDKTTSVASWLENAGRDNALPHYNLPSTKKGAFSPTNATVSIRIKISKPSKDRRKILYWAAKPKVISDKKILGALASYGRYTNMGITYVNTDGFATFKIRAPRPYKENDRVWPPHVHYTYANKNEWSTTVWAVAAYPGHHGKKLRTGPHAGEYEYEMKCLNDNTNQCSILTPEQVYRYWNDLIVVCALPEQYKVALPKHSAKSDRNRHIVVPYKSSNDVVKQACRRIGDKPYVVYCANPTCMAASQLIGRLVECGARNVYYMPAGFEGWNQMLRKKSRENNSS